MDLIKSAYCILLPEGATPQNLLSPSCHPMNIFLDPPLERCNTSISPKAELKVKVFLNVGHQKGSEVETSVTSAAAKLTGKFSDLINLKVCVGFSHSLVLI
jgi:hypothetical protein